MLSAPFNPLTDILMARADNLSHQPKYPYTSISVWGWISCTLNTNLVLPKGGEGGEKKKKNTTTTWLKITSRGQCLHTSSHTWPTPQNYSAEKLWIRLTNTIRWSVSWINKWVKGWVFCLHWDGMYKKIKNKKSRGQKTSWIVLWRFRNARWNMF